MSDFLQLIVTLDMTIRLATVLLIACIAGLYSERSGIFDIGLEGKMLLSAFVSAAAAYETGSAWVGLIPFSMRHVGLPHGPGVPYLGAFAETNVRTYVHVNGKPGVWFFSLDVDRLIPALVARLTYRLPYCWGLTSHERVGDTLTTLVRRRWPNPVADTRLVVEMGAPVAADELDLYLAARWGLYSRSRRGVRYAPVQHEPWPLRAATLHEIDQSLVQAAGLPAPTGTPHVRASNGVSVRIGLPRRS